MINLQNWADKFDELQNNPNPFAVVILAQLIAHNVNDKQQKFDCKFQLIKLFYQRSYSRQQILDLFRFIDWMIQLPKELELELTHEVTRMEEEDKMAYMTNIERFAIERGDAIGEAKGRDEGEIRGEIRGEINTLLRQLKLKFGSIPEGVESKVMSANKTQLDDWVERILTADSLQSLFKTD